MHTDALFESVQISETFSKINKRIRWNDGQIDGQKNRHGKL